MRRQLVRLASVLQGLVLGALLAHAIFGLSMISNGVRIFRYQGF